MAIKVAQGDPIETARRKARAARRVGVGSRCAGCAEERPDALIAGSNPMMCVECQRKVKLRSSLDKHHLAGKNNGPATFPVAANDHRAELSTAQQAWPQRTLENPNGSPFLAAAAHIRGYADAIVYLVNACLSWIPELLEWLDQLLESKLGAKWWLRENPPIPNSIKRSLRRG